MYSFNWHFWKYSDMFKADEGSEYKGEYGLNRSFFEKQSYSKSRQTEVPRFFEYFKVRRMKQN